MRKHNITGLLFAAALAMAGSQMGVLESQARPHHGDDWEDRWDDEDDDRWDDDEDDDRWDDDEDDDRWDDDEDDDRWDDDDDDDRWDDDDDDHHWGGGNGGNNNGGHRPAVGGFVNVVYFCEEDNTVWANGEIWASGLADRKGNVNSSELTNVPEGYKLKEVGDFYYDGGSELRIQVVPEETRGGYVNVVYYCEATNHVWANGEIWAEGLVNGKGNVNSSELTNVPEGYKLKEVGDFYYDGGAELRIPVIQWYR